jgi:hypothetical protein
VGLGLAVTQAVEHLPSKHKALSSISILKKQGLVGSFLPLEAGL